jgi:hypothetical protein
MLHHTSYTHIKILSVITEQTYIETKDCSLIYDHNCWYINLKLLNFRASISRLHYFFTARLFFMTKHYKFMDKQTYCNLEVNPR